MLHLEPLTTTNLLSILQILVTALGFYFAWRSLSLSTENAQAQLFNQMVLQGRDLTFKFMDIFLEDQTTEAKQKKRSMFTGAVLGYHASCFELRKVLTMPLQVKKLLDAELRELLRERAVQEKWEEVRHMYSKDFNQHVQDVRGIQ